jgi:hypothetical protein
MVVVVMNSVHHERRSLNRVLYALALITKAARGRNCAALMTAGDGSGSNHDLVSHKQHGRRMSDHHRQFQTERPHRCPKHRGGIGGCVNTTLQLTNPAVPSVPRPQGITFAAPSWQPLMSTPQYASISDLRKGPQQITRYPSLFNLLLSLYSTTRY